MTDDTWARCPPNPRRRSARADSTGNKSKHPGATATTWTPEAAAAEIKALRAEAAKYRKERADARKAQEKADAERLAEQGKGKELYESTQSRLAEAEPLRERYEAVIRKSRRRTRPALRRSHEPMRTLVPSMTTCWKVAAWPDANAAVFQKTPPPKLDGAAAGQGGGTRHGNR